MTPSSSLALRSIVASFAPPARAISVARPVKRTWQMDLNSPSVSFPRLLVPRYRGEMVDFVERWVNYLWWHAKVFARAAALFPVIGWVLAMTIGYHTTVRNNKLQAIIDAVDLGSAGGTDKWYDGTRPATGGTATTLLGTLTFSTTSATKASGVLTFNSITDDTSADATSTVTWGRVADSDAVTYVFDHSIAASAADIVVNTASIVTGARLSITSWTITDGNP